MNLEQLRLDVAAYPVVAIRRSLHRSEERLFLTPWTEATPENLARIVVSRDARGDEALVSDRLRLTADRWAEPSQPPVQVDGVEYALGMFVG